MKGTRVYEDATGCLPTVVEGDYFIFDGVWYCNCPGGHMANLKLHKVTEHEDGTITVSPSILVSSTGQDGERVELWHGYLRRGVFKSC